MIRNAYSFHPRRHWWAIAPFVAVLSLACADGASAQAGQRIFRSVPEQGDTTHVAVPGGRFEMGRFGRWIYGSDYRQLWTTPIELPVLDRMPWAADCHPCVRAAPASPFRCIS